MAKFFLPILLFLIGLWVYVVISEQKQKVEVNDADAILKEFEIYSHLNDSIKELPDYYDFFQMSYKGLTFFIPNHLVLSSELSKSAALQYENVKREFYIVLYSNQVDKYTEEFKDADQYAKATIASIQTHVTDFKMIDSSVVSINNCKAIKMEFTGNFDNGESILPLKYKVLVTEFENYLYDLTEWTIVDNLPENEKEMDRIISSVTNMPDVDMAREKIME
jgi:hypothetical protein